MRDELTILMQYQGTKVMFSAYVPTQSELAKFPYVIMTGPSGCNLDFVSMTIQ